MNVTMMTKLCNVVLRRPYLDESVLRHTWRQSKRLTPTRIINPNATEQPVFFARMGNELFRNVRDLFEQIDVQFAARGSDESVGAQMAVRTLRRISLAFRTPRMLTISVLLCL